MYACLEKVILLAGVTVELTVPQLKDEGWPAGNEGKRRQLQSASRSRMKLKRNMRISRRGTWRHTALHSCAYGQEWLSHLHDDRDRSLKIPAFGKSTSKGSQQYFSDAITRAAVAFASVLRNDNHVLPHDQLHQPMYVQVLQVVLVTFVRTWKMVERSQRVHAKWIVPKYALIAQSVVDII